MMAGYTCTVMWGKWDPSLFWCENCHLLKVKLIIFVRKYLAHSKAERKGKNQFATGLAYKKKTQKTLVIFYSSFYRGIIVRSHTHSLTEPPPVDAAHHVPHGAAQAGHYREGGQAQSVVL